MEIVYSINKVPIRLTEERWLHIVENHNDLAGHHDEILSTVESPDFIVRGYRNAIIAIKKMGNKYLAVVYKEILKNDGFIITAYFTSEIKKEEIVWQKQL